MEIFYYNFWDDTTIIIVSIHLNIGNCKLKIKENAKDRGKSKKMLSHFFLTICY